MHKTCYCVFAILALTSPVFALEGPTLHERFAAEAPTSWAKLEDAYAHVEYKITCEYSETVGSNPTKTLLNSAVCKHNGICINIHGQLDLNFKDRTSRGAIVRNSRYGFAITDKKADGNWRLDNSDAADAEGYQTIFANVADWAKPGCYLHDPVSFKITDLIQDSQFQIVNVEAQGSLVRVRTTANRKKFNGKSEVRNGDLLLDPSHDWQIQESRFEVPTSKYTTICKYKYCDFQDRQLLSDIDIKTSAPHGTTHSSIRYLDYRPCNDPESDFTLTAFGLPEPIGTVWVHSTPRYVWWLLAAFTFAILAFLTRILLSKSNQSRSKLDP